MSVPPRKTRQLCTYFRLRPVTCGNVNFTTTNGGLLRSRYVLGSVPVASRTATLPVLVSAVAEVGYVREQLMAMRSANRWKCSSGACVLTGGGRACAVSGREQTSTGAVVPFTAPLAP